jgi:COMPASS component SPP1
MTVDPYETNPERIPGDDPFLVKSAQYGRYTPHPDDFNPHYNHWYQSDPDANAFWQDIARKFCTPEHSLGISGPREAFAAGSVIIRVDCEVADGAAAERYSCVNANELSAARKAEDTLREIGVAVPMIYFCGTIEGRNVTVESRIPGVSLDVAWRYLSTKKIDAFKNQCRQILQQLETIDPPSDEPSYVCRGLNSQTPPSGTEQERSILFAEKVAEEELVLTHNDLVLPNVIVKNDRVVGITGWRQSGYFGLARAQKIHQSLRNLEPSDKAAGGATWIDLYDGSYDSSKGEPLSRSLDTALPSVKTEPMSSTLDKFPASDDLETRSFGLDGTSDQPTSKTLENLKNGPYSRASSSDRSSPANSVKPTSNKKGSAASKKGTAKKPAAKKRKPNDDADSVDGRSNTPMSRTSKTPGKKQSSVSVAGSPPPENKKKKKKKKPGKVAVTGEDEDSYEDENTVFCICRRPDNHTWMIGCDGDCDDWYHGKCVNIDPRDADLIDRYICECPVHPASNHFSNQSRPELQQAW